MKEEQIEILKHTVSGAAGGLYCGDSKDMQGLVKAGLMESAGRKSFVPDEFFRITASGRACFVKIKRRYRNKGKL